MRSLSNKRNVTTPYSYFRKLQNLEEYALSNFLLFTVSTGELADLINAIQTNDQKAVEINGHLIQAKNLNNVTVESSDQNQCQDNYPTGCPGWKWACTHPWYIAFMQNNCQKSCGLCSTGM